MPSLLLTFLLLSLLPQNMSTNPNNLNNNIPQHHYQPSSSRSSASTNQACAACKYQRRRCSAECQLAPYFPADDQRQFLNAHRLYGVSNILRVLKKIDRQFHPHAMRSIKYESDMRAEDPVGGCYRLIVELAKMLEWCTNELVVTRRHLELHRAQHVHHNVVSGGDLLDNEMIIAQQQQQQQQQCFDYLCPVYRRIHGFKLESPMHILRQIPKRLYSTSCFKLIEYNTTLSHFNPMLIIILHARLRSIFLSIFVLVVFH